MRIRNILLVCLIFALQNTTMAQFSEEYMHYKALYPDDDKVVLNVSTELQVKMVKGEIAISLKHFEEDLYLNATANHFSEGSVSYSSFYELLNIEASSFVFTDGKYKQLKVKDFKHKDDLSGHAFYDDGRKVSFLYSNLQQGAKSTLMYEEKINDPRFINLFLLGSVYPVVNATYSITADAGIKFQFKEFNTDSIDLVFTQEEKKGKITYRWVAKNVAKYEIEDNPISFRSTIPHLIPYIESYEVDGNKVELLNNVDGLYHWYYQLVKDINTGESNPELVGIVNELIKDQPDEISKVRAIYYWVQQNIKYVAFEYALGGFVPREGNEVFTKKYGDCKDNSSILQEMLQIAQIPGHLTWIGTRSIPYSYHEVPTPVVDNHMILSYIHDKTVYFLDATSRFLPLELPSHFIQGKEALISIDSNHYRIMQVPVVDAQENFTFDSVELQIQDGSLSGKGKFKVGGFYKIAFFDILEQNKSQHELTKLYNINLQKGSNKFLISQFEEINKYDYDQPFLVNYSFVIDQYVLKADDEMYVNLNLAKDVIDLKIKKEDKLDKEYNYKTSFDYYYILEIPDGYHINYLPKNTTLVNDLYSAHIEYTLDENQIIYHHDFITNFLILKKADHAGFNDFLDQLDKAYKESIVLKKNN